MQKIGIGVLCGLLALLLLVSTVTCFADTVAPQKRIPCM